MSGGNDHRTLEAGRLKPPITLATLPAASAELDATANLPNADPTSLEARAVRAHEDLIAAEKALELAKEDRKVKTRAYLQAIVEWRAKGRYTDFITEMMRALRICKATADNHLRAAGVAERTGLLDAQQAHRMPQLTALGIIGRMANSHDEGKCRYAQNLEGQVRSGKPLPRLSELKRAASGDWANDLHVDMKDVAPVPAAVGAYNLLKTLALSGDDLARNSINDLLAAIERGGEMRIRFSGSIKLNLDEPMRQELLDLLRGDLATTKETDDEGEDNTSAALTGMAALRISVATAVAAPVETDDEPAVVGQEVPADAAKW